LIGGYALAGILYFAKGLSRAAIDRDAGAFDHRAYRPLLLDGKTACVVGAGGIGRDVGKLCYSSRERFARSRSRKRHCNAGCGYGRAGSADLTFQVTASADATAAVAARCGSWMEMPMEQQPVAILGWGSLIWDSAHPRAACFDRWHDAWQDDGPPTRVNTFCRGGSVETRENSSLIDGPLTSFAPRAGTDSVGQRPCPSMVSTHSPRPGGGTHAVPPTPPSGSVHHVD
jgi:hypothetical protein